ncbi:hypothetical protein BLA23254_07461 [Burkholderia lata]|uniref:Uncharacterized protein n=1 Tax=Burkholderia lata (strain ATCC 17760 / DSM 23089 / LMG 22485 / NCIMB 9086 / R18194 / 383) TaxID=482957 RepID=A0A6P2SU81_BURL3|nr:hypothetical protein [Burkholderia lata]VWC47274.1 hypothetical protein BLA23254_07461 [Burkholderia lata]
MVDRDAFERVAFRLITYRTSLWQKAVRRELARLIVDMIKALGIYSRFEHRKQFVPDLKYQRIKIGR